MGRPLMVTDKQGKSSDLRPYLMNAFVKEYKGSTGLERAKQRLSGTPGASIVPTPVRKSILGGGSGGATTLGRSTG